MTDFQFRAIIKMVIKIIASCKSIEEALDALRDLINEDRKESDS